MKSSEIKKISLAGILASVSATILIIGSFFEIIDLTLSVAASFPVIISIIELKGKYPLIIYAVSSVISTIIMPMRAAPLFFIFFVGYYPIIKVKLLKINRHLSFGIKIFIFNIACFAMLFLFKSVFGMQDLTPLLWVITFLTLNLFFLIYDYALGGIIVIYCKKFRKMFKIRK